MIVNQKNYMELMKKYTTIGGWLKYKQDPESLKMLQKYVNYFVTIDGYLKLRVVQHVKNNYTRIGRILYKTKDCYEDDITFYKFCKNVLDSINENSADDLKVLIEKSIDIIAAKDDKLKKIDRADIKKSILCYIFFTTYVGYAFEQQIRELITSSERFKICKIDLFDKKYAIDLVVLDKLTNKRIGLQFKSFTFLGMSIDKRRCYKNRNKEAIQEKFVDDVYYIFHNHVGEIVTNNFQQIINYKEACESDDNIVLIEDVNYFIRELIGSFECLSRRKLKVVV